MFLTMPKQCGIMNELLLMKKTTKSNKLNLENERLNSV